MKMNDMYLLTGIIYSKSVRTQYAFAYVANSDSKDGAIAMWNKYFEDRFTDDDLANWTFYFNEIEDITKPKVWDI